MGDRLEEVALTPESSDSFPKMQRISCPEHSSQVLFAELIASSNLSPVPVLDPKAWGSVGGGSPMSHPALGCSRKS